MGMPFDDNAITLIMGLCPDDPMAPGMHGPVEKGNQEDAEAILCKIKDLVCGYFEGKDEPCMEEADTDDDKEDEDVL